MDLFAGSYTTLVDATMMAKNVKVVGVDIVSVLKMNRHDIVQDFISRGSDPPSLLIEGDITDEKIRDETREAVYTDRNRKTSFDVVITDPPYRIRETMVDKDNSFNNDQINPLLRLVECLATDRIYEKPSVRKGGRLVIFVLVHSHEKLVT